MKNFEDIFYEKPIMIAGPCSVESEEQIDEVAKSVSELGIRLLRGGAYKPRTSPDAFQGLGKKGAEMLREAADKHGLLTVSEVMTIDDLEESYDLIDVIQIGARNMASYGFLKQVAEMTKEDHKPILLKRHFGATLTEFLKASDYLSMYGNKNILLCLRGIRTFEQIDSDLRFTPDIGAILDIKEKSRYPIIFDPSHPAGKRKYVGVLSKVALEAGADGLIVEVHPDPENALSDKDQALSISSFRDLFNSIKKR